MGSYRGTLRSLIRLLKFDDRLELAPPLAARAHTFLARRRPGLPPVDLIVPVPLPALRRLRRGYNQAAEVARALGRLTGLPVEARGLARRRLGRPQTGLPATRRAANVRGAFRPRHAPRLVGRSVLLLDDVWTTGATLRECARALRRGGARRVVAFSLARVSDDFDADPTPGL
jgi:ComF family protein